jgi:radical SAM superfamily enzyme YgiQ (UPF0313 family)
MASILDTHDVFRRRCTAVLEDRSRRNRKKVTNSPAIRTEMSFLSDCVDFLPISVYLSTGMETPNHITLLLTPPMVQFNAPYPATPVLTAFLRSHNVNVTQSDLALTFALRLFSRRGLCEVQEELDRTGKNRTPSVANFLAHAAAYQATVDTVVGCLQRNPGDESMSEPANAKSLRRITRIRMPRGPRFTVLDELAVAGIDPAADREGYPRLLASLYLDDLADAIQQGVDARFGLSRYAEGLAVAADSFSPLLKSLRASPGLLDRMLDRLTLDLLLRVKPDLVGITIPFPGNVYAAFRIARLVKIWNPRVRTVVGGGYVNTELRSLSDPRVFDFFDFITYDDGEMPLLRVIGHVTGQVPQESLIRTRMRIGRRVVYIDSDAPEIRHRTRPAPCYEGLALDRYCGVAESINPMHRLWAERCWMKISLAHGCYWHQCAFCDTGLDYIARYDPADSDTVVRWIREVKDRTGVAHFHFVDEAAPPALLRHLATALIRCRIRIRWWANIRFEERFTADAAALLVDSGCIALSGGLECAQRDLIATMNKGITLPGAVRAMHAISQAGILVHAYLMYGFPRQTVQETVDALELVRQLFRTGFLNSAYWHRFALTVHSPIFRNPELFGVRVLPPTGTFARNEVPFTDGQRTDHAMLGKALHRAVYNYMHGIGMDENVRSWFDRRVPSPRVSDDFVTAAVAAKSD